MEENRTLKIILVVLLVLILASMVALGYFFFKSGGDEEISKVIKTKEDEKTKVLEEFVVNLKPDDKKRYLKVTVALMYRDKDGDNTEYIDNNINKIRDSITNLLRSKTAEDVQDVENVSKLKEEIVLGINTAIDLELIEDVYFTDLVVQ